MLEEEGEVVVRTASSLTPTTDGRDNCVEMTYLLHLLLSLNFSTEE